MVSLFFRHSLDQLKWSDDEARRYLTPMIREGSYHYVRNSRCQLGVAQVEGIEIPFTVTDFVPNNTYICSPYNHYVTYAQEELRNLGNPPVERALHAVIGGLGRVIHPDSFDKVVMVNNWLLSTNLYPALTGKQATTLLYTFAEAYPDRAILFRSVDRFRNPHLVTALSEAGAVPTFTRQIWYQEARADAVQKSRDFRNDLKLLRCSPYTVVQNVDTLSDAEIERVVMLYNLLYLDKYSYHNPQFTPRFVRHMLDEKLMRFTLLVQDGRIDGMYGYVRRNGVMAQPLLGYDTHLPQETGLYRLLSALILLEAQATDSLCHASSGVGRFKKLRGGIGTEEYSMVYTRHLAAYRRRAWQLLKVILDKVAVPMIQQGGY